MPRTVKPRTQHSPLRRAQAAATRARILDAAVAVFAAQGYARTRVEDIAVSAGVAYPTVYKTFGNKPAVLAAAVAHAMGDGDGEPMDRQAWFQEQLAADDAVTQLRLVARNARRLYERAGRVLDVVRTTAPGDAEVERLWQSINEERLDRSRATARRLASKAVLRTGATETARTLWALTLPEIYVMQVDHGDLTPERYERWLGELLVAALLEAP